MRPDLDCYRLPSWSVGDNSTLGNQIVVLLYVCGIDGGRDGRCPLSTLRRGSRLCVAASRDSFWKVGLVWFCCISFGRFSSKKPTVAHEEEKNCMSTDHNFDVAEHHSY
mmetsp:Transcript_27559/g.60873  ORF Transcript_27559/g.60873 Transcript_27559/m.60873 type:complete len:109 (+) Transcript_27559:1363-1689(+)